MSATATVVVPATLTLDSSTATSAYSEWNSGTSYSVGDRVLVSSGDVPTEYEAVASNSNKAPASNTDVWLRIGVSNPYRMLDGRSSNATSKTDGFTATVSASGRMTHVAFLGIDNATSITLSIEDGSGTTVDWEGADGEGTSAGSGTIALNDRASSTWSEYFFDGFGETKRAIVFVMAGWVADPEVTFTLTGVGDVDLAHVIVGRSQQLGCTLYGVTTDLESFSTREFDDFGTPTLIQRISAQRTEVTLIIDDGAADTLVRLRRQLDAVPALWDMSNEYTHLRTYAFFESFDLEMYGYNETYVSIDLVEMT